MIELMDLTKENIIAAKPHDTITIADYHGIQPLIKGIVGQGRKIRWYFDLQDFAGWEADAIWEEAKTDIRYADDFERIAIVGSRKWQKLADALREFTPAEVRYFDAQEQDQARRWISVYET